MFKWHQVDVASQKLNELDTIDNTSHITAIGAIYIHFFSGQLLGLVLLSLAVRLALYCSTFVHYNI